MLDSLLWAALWISPSNANDARAEAAGELWGTITGLVLGLALGAFLIFVLIRRLMAFSSPPAAAAVPPPNPKRRLAQTIVAEIRLQNAREVDEGRRCRDLATRFKNELERSYRTFAGLAGGGNESERIFHEVVVKILAAGDAGALGSPPRSSEASAPVRQ